MSTARRVGLIAVVMAGLVASLVVRSSLHGSEQACRAGLGSANHCATVSSIFNFATVVMVVLIIALVGGGIGLFIVSREPPSGDGWKGVDRPLAGPSDPQASMRTPSPGPTRTAPSQPPVPRPKSGGQGWSAIDERCR